MGCYLGVPRIYFNHFLASTVFLFVKFLLHALDSVFACGVLFFLDQFNSGLF